MSRPRTLLCLAYAAIAVLALVATWHQNAAYFGAGNPLSATVRFWKETLVTPASISITVDIFLFGLAATIWMVIEARRLGIRFVWLYVVAGALIAISVSFPLFLIARERRLQVQRGEEPFELTRADAIGLGLFGLPTVLLSLWSLLS